MLQGLAAGVPVITSAGGGPSEIITDQVNGLLFASGDRDALAGVERR